MRDLFHVGVWIVFTLLATAVGLSFLVVGIYRAIKHEGGNDSWSYKRGAKKGHKFSVAGNVAWAVAGVACLVASLVLVVNGLVPAVDAVLPDDHDQPVGGSAASANPARTPSGSAPTTPASSPAAPVVDAVVFKTPHKPHGVVCATFRHMDGMGCVVTDHSNKGGYGRKGCKILFTVNFSGTTAYKQCPSESDLGRLLYGYPFTGKATGYGATFDMGVATCELTTDYTECADPRTGDVLLRLNDARSKPVVK